MQHQRLVPGKPPQAPMNQGLAACRKVWHHDDDYIFRNGIRLQIIGLLQKHGLQKNLEEVSYWAERVLYMGAASKEEYGDLMTLENRLCSFMLRLRNGQKAAHHGLQQGSPVLQAPILGSSERSTPSPGSNYFQVSEVQLQCQQSPSTHQQLEKTSSADTGQSEVVNNDDSLAPGQVEETPPLQSTKWQQWFLVLLRHVSRCADLKPCTFPECEAGRKTWSHLTTCNSYPCSYPRCMQLKKLLWHHKNCRNSKCLICYPLRSNYSRQSLMAQVHMGKDMDMKSAVFVSELASHEFEPAPQKRRKLEAQVLEQQLQSTDGSLEQMTCGDVLLAPKHEMGPPFPVTKHTEHQASSSEVCKVESCSPRTESCPQSSLIVGPFSQYCTISEIVNGPNVVPDCVRDASVPQLAGPVDVKIRHESPKQFAVALKNDNKSANVRVSGISYLEILTPQQIKQHISNLREWIGQSDQALEEQEMPTSVCSTCGADELRFDPIPIFCTHCGCRIKRSAIYHTAGSGEKSLNLCGPCRSAIRGDMVETGHYKVHKSMLEKKTNDEQRAEGWVECDKCKKWQHQICGLFNARVNKETSEYFCPECCLAEMERGERMPCPENFMPRAKDLPRTALSDHVEERLAWKLKEEKVERATALGKSLEEVPSADGLVLRVVSSVDKKLEVKPRFLELFQQENYPKEFLYKSKMLILFQDIGGVEVCLFGMYVQEFGAENPQPNHRHTYLAYLDSVKYFHPDVKTIRGEALRTFVYHEILISYLDYCKKRGFSSCYIWACPPLKGDDYILYSHPQIQKTPKPDKLREWYLSMIAKAKEEGVVVANTNMYDYYFTSNSDCKAKVTAARLPYFDGDYWPGAAEDILHQLQQEDNDLHSQRRGKAKKIAKKRTTKTSMQTEATSTMSRDLQLMYKLGHSIMAMKEDFIMVHMHHSCSYCHNFIVSGQRWFCELCAGDFQLCKHCYEDHQKLGVEEQHPIGKKECHLLSMEEVKDIPTDTVDEDEIIESEFYDNRHAFLGLCQGNQYQFDTLRRAKHSSMMVVYHLHNPNVPAFIICCSICHNGMETGHGWKCRVCPEFNVCNSCFSSPEVQGHHHEFVGQMTLADSNAGAFQQRMQLLRIRLETLVHASTCGDASCQQECRDMKTLFRHGCLCKQRAMGGCLPCKRMWYLLTCHARSCEKDPCTVPRCQDLKKHMRWMQQQQESQRRAAVNEMVRQRAAETSHI